MADQVPNEADPPAELSAPEAGAAEPALEGELVGTPAVSEVRALTPSRQPPTPSVRTAAAAAGGFLAGAATLALLHRRDAKRLARALARPTLEAGPPLFPSSGGRSYLVDVHVVTKRPR